ncbi:sigma 54-interacting transcriptional regulator [[Brevibacterium] frigoritolerans]|uniref:Sigma 54-interacting transcriptional regulator n=1 Tax=Peribacillus frigoritolerans TaxID=450367 RepID=A0A941FHK2_9BACI|nr:sigma 54-interacting transcriptional regulator [Peribacillus frigoritolerans]
MEARMHFNQLVAINTNLKEQLDTAFKFSKSNHPVLIYGESGSGKKVLRKLFTMRVIGKNTRLSF